MVRSCFPTNTHHTHAPQRNVHAHAHAHAHTRTHTQTDRQTETDRHRQTQTDTDRHRQTQTDTDRHRQTQTDTDRHRQTQTDTDRHRQTQTDTDRHRQRFWADIAAIVRTEGGPAVLHEWMGMWTQAFVLLVIHADLASVLKVSSSSSASLSSRCEQESSKLLQERGTSCWNRLDYKLIGEKRCGALRNKTVWQQAHHCVGNSDHSTNTTRRRVFKLWKCGSLSMATSTKELAEREVSAWRRFYALRQLLCDVCVALRNTLRLLRSCVVSFALSVLCKVDLKIVS